MIGQLYRQGLLSPKVYKNIIGDVGNCQWKNKPLNSL